MISPIFFQKKVEFTSKSSTMKLLVNARSMIQHRLLFIFCKSNCYFLL